jgi:hypothetical protein
MKRGYDDAVGPGGDTADEPVGPDGSAEDSQMSGLLMANKLLYHFPHDFSVIVNSTKKESLFAQRAYRDGETMMCTIMTGADFVDPLRSYVTFDMDARLTGPGCWWEHERCGFGANNTACNFIKSIVVKSRSGDELMRTNNFNVLAAQRMLYVYDEGWWKSIGSTITNTYDATATAQGLINLGRKTSVSLLDAGASADIAKLESRTQTKTWVTGKHRVNIPLYCLGGIFATDKLLPANLMSGLVIQITLADAKDVFVWHAQKSGPTRSVASITSFFQRNGKSAIHPMETDVLELNLKGKSGGAISHFTHEVATGLFTLQSSNLAATADTNLSSSHPFGVGDVLVVRDQSTSAKDATAVYRIDRLIANSGATTHSFQVSAIPTLLLSNPTVNTAVTPLVKVSTTAGISVRVIKTQGRDIDRASFLSSNVAPNLGESACETRQMKNAMTREDLLQAGAWGFTSTGAAHTDLTTGDDAKREATETVFNNTQFSAEYDIFVPRVICHCNQLTDSAQRAINATSAHNGLEIVYYDFENTQAPAQGRDIHIEVKKAVSRAMKAIAIVRPNELAGTNTNTCIKTHTNTFACQPWNVKDYQWQLGALYFPHQRIEGHGDGPNFPDGIPFTAGMAYSEALDCFAGYAPKRNYCSVEFQEFTGVTIDKGVKAGALVGNLRVNSDEPSSALVNVARKVLTQDPSYRCNGVIAQSLERSGIFELSGLPINNSRVLVLHATFDNSDIADDETNKVQVDIFLKYVKVARVFMQMVEVES